MSTNPKPSSQLEQAINCLLLELEKNTYIEFFTKQHIKTSCITIKKLYPQLLNLNEKQRSDYLNAISFLQQTSKDLENKRPKAKKILGITFMVLGIALLSLVILSMAHVIPATILLGAAIANVTKANVIFTELTALAAFTSIGGGVLFSEANEDIKNKPLVEATKEVIGIVDHGHRGQASGASLLRIG